MVGWSSIAQVSAPSDGVNPGQVAGTSPPRPTALIQARAGLLIVLLLLQAELSDSANAEPDEASEPLGVELSLLLVMMTLAVLFVWESSKQCLRTCCTRRDGGDYEVRVVTTTDGDEVSHRRERRQQAVRRAIEREVQEDGLRHRGQGSVSTYGSPSLSSHVHVTLDHPVSSIPGPQEPPWTSTRVASPPPPPPRLGSGGSSSREPPTSFRDKPASSSSAAVPPPPPIPDHGIQRLCSPERKGFGQRPQRDASTQTTRERGFDFQELCELHVLTTTGRGPGAVHLFPGCHALRHSTTHQRMFCRYCLQAARDARRNQSSILEG